MGNPNYLVGGCEAQPPNVGFSPHDAPGMPPHMMQRQMVIFMIYTDLLKLIRKREEV